MLGSWDGAEAVSWQRRRPGKGGSAKGGACCVASIVDPGGYVIRIADSIRDRVPHAVEKLIGFDPISGKDGQFG